MEVKSIIVQAVEKVEIVNETIDESKIGDFEVFIENHYSHISPGTELSRVFGIKIGATYPCRVGYCSVGKVLDKGKEIKGIEVGDFVLYSGTHSSYHIFDYRSSDGGVLYKLDPRLPKHEAVCLVMAGIAANGILSADLKSTDKVAIFGLGILGYILTILYNHAGVKVIGVDSMTKRAEKLPLDLYIDDPNVAVEKIMEHTEGFGTDITIDASGTSAGIISAVMATRKYGQVILLGSPRATYECDITPMLNTIHMRNLTVIGALNRMFPFTEKEGSRLCVTRTLDYLTDLMLRKIIDTNDLISHIIKPEDAFSAYHGLMYDKNNYLGVIIDWRNQL